MESPLVSIIIRARDEEPALRRLLPLLKGQQADFAFEIWLLDNDSRDGTAALAREQDVCYHHIPRAGFNYAAALNLGASLARGEYLVHLSAHCFPLGTRWLADLVAPLRRDPTVVATYGRQITDPQQSPFEALGDRMLFPEAGQPELTAFSNANAAIRRSVVLLHPFNPAIQILEDHLFYLELAEDYQFVYVPEAAVAHEHSAFSWRYYVRRWLREGWAQFFLRRHRGAPTKLIPKHIVQPREIVFGYPYIAGALLKRRRWRAALLTMPFFLLRDATWLAAFTRARLLHAAMSQRDTELLLRTNRFLLRQVLDRGGAAVPEAPLDWPEEWQLKADWGFIRANIAHFIRRCHEQGLISGPLLEVGAAGQNDYLAEWYELRTSNLADNRQGAELALDMEDMREIADASLGTILCSEVIEHVRHPERALAEAFRTLRPGGTLIVTTPYSIVIHDSPDDGGFHGRNFTPQGLELLAREAGFAIELLETRGRTEARRKLMPSNVFMVARRPA